MNGASRRQRPGHLHILASTKEDRRALGYLSTWLRVPHLDSQATLKILPRGPLCLTSAAHTLAGRARARDLDIDHAAIAGATSERLALVMSGCRNRGIGMRLMW
jgi:hypothetical protein